MKIADQKKGLFVGNSLLGGQNLTVSERIERKKSLYRKEAGHVISTAARGEKKVDDSINRARERVQALMDDNDEANRQLNGIKNQMSEAMESYGVEADSQEQQDLELLEKAYDFQKEGHSLLELSDEEQERLKNMGEMTEYQKYSMELYEQADYWKDTMQKNQNKISGETAAIRDVSIKRLESHAMADAQKTKEEILAAASKEAVGMLAEDAKSQIDEKAKEVEEKAKERQEKDEEEQERIQAAKENSAEAQETAEKTRETSREMTDIATDSSQLSKDVSGQIQKILEEEKLLEEDLKGMNVNTAI
jgi:hypothetical protein